jgi:hypothetical protein
MSRAEKLEAELAAAEGALAAAAVRDTPPAVVAVLERRWRQADVALQSHRLKVARRRGDDQAEYDALDMLRDALSEEWMVTP